ncbi:carboxyl transferase domain-containing protein, partial [Streptomyces solincola]|uniref:carboxyl transferase domain-containing protein n=1 Tax=Streptomyces solincola TaxID=2100817 RepID=UPI002AFF5DD8
MADAVAGGRLTSAEAISLVAEVFEEQRPPERAGAPDGPLGWAGYDAARARAAEATGAAESVRYGLAVVGGHRCVLLVFEFGFLGGSLGERAGDRLAAAYRLAGRERVPLVSLVATGGSRMQEGMVALGQLQRVAREAAALRAAAVPHLAVLRDPATGGGWATVGAGADVVLALPGAQVGFAGSRVRPPDADPSAYTAEGQFAAGQVDAVVPPEHLRETLARWLGALRRTATEGPPEPAPVPQRPPQSPPVESPVRGWDAVRAARAPERPRADAYLDHYFA